MSGIYKTNASVFPWLMTIVFFCSVIFMSSCEENIPEQQVAIFERGTVMDVDSNVYVTVKIGNQWWMAENLKVTRYNNGDPIANLSDSSDWSNGLVGAYCEYENGSGVLDPPGLLYNHKAVTDSRGLAPAGWRVPSDEDWKLLERALGMTIAASDGLAWRGSNQGDQLKSENLNSWKNSDNAFPNNKSGFTALGGSCRLFNSLWGYPGIKHTGFWWTSSLYQIDQAWYRYLDYNESAVFRSYVDVRYGMSLRCVKN